jgi:methionine synthase / methylenetetrahydrofolate reductase(NADPH)
MIAGNPRCVATNQGTPAGNARAEGVAIAQEMVERARPLTAGVQLSAPFGRYEMAIQVAGAIGSRD